MRSLPTTDSRLTKASEGAAGGPAVVGGHAGTAAGGWGSGSACQ